VWPYSSLLHKCCSSLLVKVIRKVRFGRAYCRSYSVKLWTSSIKVLIVMGWSKPSILSFFSLNLFKYALMLSPFHWIMKKNLVELLDLVVDLIISHLAWIWAKLFFHLEPLFQILVIYIMFYFECCITII
jgi:hypothetical protein